MSADKCHCEEGLPEWIMSYADMITILMAFFVVMYSMAGNKDTAKEQAVLKSLRNQFGPMLSGWGSLVPDHLLRRNSSQVDLPFKGGTKSKNRNRGGADHERWPEGDHARVHAPWPGEQSRVGGVIYFPEDSDKLGETQEQSLKLMASELGGKPQKIEIRGHSSRRLTDNNAEDKDHWDLAYDRCRATMKYLVSLGIDPKRLRLAVAGEHEPVSQGVARSTFNNVQNSRVEVFMLNEVVNPDGGKPRWKRSEPSMKPDKPEKPEVKTAS